MTTSDAVYAAYARHSNRTGQVPATVRLGLAQRRAFLLEIAPYTPELLEPRNDPRLYGMRILLDDRPDVLEVG